MCFVALTFMCFVTTTAFAVCTTAKYVEGHLITAEKWAYLARFCFLSWEGRFKYEITYDMEYGIQRLLLYFDTKDQWPAVYGTSKTCEEKVSVLNYTNFQLLNMTVGDYGFGSGCDILPATETEKTRYFCSGNHGFESARERWWFIAVSNCQSTKGLNLKYKFWMTNGIPGDVWHYHFSADEFYILLILIVFAVLHSILLLGSIGCAVRLRARQLLHTTYKLVMISIALQLLGILILCIAYGKYAKNGIGAPRLKHLGLICESVSDIVFLLLLILISKGYTITRARLRQSGTIKLTIFMCIYCITYAALFIHEQEFFDPGRVLYLYESPAGYGLIIMRLIGWGMLIYSIFFTLKHYPEKSSFYLPFFGFYTLWCVSGPVFIIMATYIIDKWVREKVVCGIEHSITFLGHFVFLILTQPSKANRRFPFHVRTSQIAVLEEHPNSQSQRIGDHTLDRFQRYPYAVTESPTRRTPIDLFTVSGVVQVNGWYAAPSTSARTTRSSKRIRSHKLSGRRSVPPGYRPATARVSDSQQQTQIATKSLTHLPSNSTETSASETLEQLPTNPYLPASAPPMYSDCVNDITTVPAQNNNNNEITKENVNT